MFSCVCYSLNPPNLTGLFVVSCWKSVRTILFLYVGKQYNSSDREHKKKGGKLFTQMKKQKQIKDGWRRIRSPVLRQEQQGRALSTESEPSEIRQTKASRKEKKGRKDSLLLFFRMSVCLLPTSLFFFYFPVKRRRQGNVYIQHARLPTSPSAAAPTSRAHTSSTIYMCVCVCIYTIHIEQEHASF